MYRVRNKVLDKIFVEYKVKDLADLSEDQLADVCGDLGVLVQMKFNPQTSMYDRPKKYDYIDAVIKNYTLSVYMGSPYWTQRHQQLATQYGVVEGMSKASFASETYALLDRIKVALNGLKPGEVAEVDWTREFVNEFLASLGMAEVMEIIDLSTDKRLERKNIGSADKPKWVFEEAVTKKDPVLLPDFSTMEWEAIKAMAEENGVGWQGRAKERVIALIIEKLSE